MGEPRLIGAVAAQELTVAPEVVLEVGRAGAEEVIAQVMGVDPDCPTTAFIRQDDLSKASLSAGRKGIAIDFAAERWAKGDPSTVAVGARSSEMQTVLDRDSRLYNPRIDVGQVRADLPTPVAWRPEPVGGLVVMVDMQRWAMYGGGKTLDWAVGRLEQWVLDAAEAIGATAGFVTAVEEDSHPTGGCPWELSQHLGPGYRDAATTVWGFGWGTLVGPVQLAAVGGVDALAPVASSIRELSGGRLWVRIGGEDPAAVTTSELDALEDVL